MERYTDYRVLYNSDYRAQKPQFVDSPAPPRPEPIPTETECHYIFIDSSYRDTANYPLHYDYKLNLKDNYTDVISVEMISCTFPNTSDILDEPVLMFDIDELNFIKANNNSGTNVFSIVPLKGPNKASGGYINPELASNHRALWCGKNKQISKLSSITVKIRDVSGELYNFGAAGGSVSKSLQHSFILKLKTCVPRRNQSSLRNE